MVPLKTSNVFMCVFQAEENIYRVTEAREHSRKLSQSHRVVSAESNGEAGEVREFPQASLTSYFLSNQDSGSCLPSSKSQLSLYFTAVFYPQEFGIRYGKALENSK